MKTARQLGIIAAATFGYALATRVLFGFAPLKESFVIVSLSFLLLVPFAFGALTAFLGCRLCGRSNFWIYLAPVIVTVIGLQASILLHFEATLCIVVAAPIVLPFAVLGGAFMGWLLSRGSGNLPVSLLVLLPFAASPIEATWNQPHETVAIRDTIRIRASPEAIWKEIVSVPAIAPAELPRQWIYLLDFPRPISAEIDREGIGARRLARFERDVTFFEVVTEMSPPRSLGFTIEADPAFVPHTAFDQHIVVGGRFYDVLDGRYVIEPGPDGCLLVLESRHRLSTPFNRYAGLWSRWVMNQIQGSILTVIKNRAERREAAQTQSRPHWPGLARSIPESVPQPAPRG